MPRRVQPIRQFLPVFVLLLPAFGGDEVHVDETADAVIVRSPIAEGNFLFRAPASFSKQAAEEPFLADLKSGTARIRLKITTLTPRDSAAGLDGLASAREAEYRLEGASKPEISGEGARRLVRTRGKERGRTLLLVVDGTRLYELLLDGDASAMGPLDEVASGFTILDPKGAPEMRVPTAAELEAKIIEHDYYRLKILKPEGFSAEEGDPEKDKGIWLRMRRLDQERNQCDIAIRIHLGKALKQGETIDDFAHQAMERFAKNHIDTRLPKRPSRTGWAGAKTAYKLKLSGRAKNGVVAQEDYRLVEHENGRLYEFQVTMYGGAPRAFKKEIAEFWRKLKIVNK